MSVAFGTVFKCSECGVSGHTSATCPEIVALSFPVGSMVGEHSTVLSVEPRVLRLRCKCGAEFCRTPSVVSRQEREGWRVTCGHWQCRGARRPTDKQYVSTRERLINGW